VSQLQGDQIGRIFDFWVSKTLGIFVNRKSLQKFWAENYHRKGFAIILSKNSSGYEHIGRFLKTHLITLAMKKPFISLQ
jgi:hypothetical protein